MLIPVMIEMIKMNKLIFLAAIIPVLLVPNVYASEDPFRTNQGNRPAINPDFDPDFDCNYDVSQIHCIPGSAQQCPKPQFSAGDPQMCFPKTLVDGEWKWRCPDDHHTVDSDETGQCYPNSEGCEWDSYVLLTDRPGKNDRCAGLIYICNEAEHKGEDYCIEYCEEDPDRFVCKPEAN